MSKYSVGQRVWIYSVNARKGTGPQQGEVVKVGRTLVTVKGIDSAWWTQVFRIETGSANDQYGHEWIKTDAEREEVDRRNAALETLREAGIRFDRAPSNVEVLEGFVEVLRRTTPGAPSAGPAS